MSRVKKNFVAGLAGSGWTALTGLICTPLYIKFLGMEAYGLIGFYFVMQGIIQILDVGLSPTMNREMARYSVLPDKADEARDFVRTLEVGYWAIGILIGLTLFLCAPLIATSWIKAGSLPRSEVVHAVRIMGILSALQWPMSFYTGGLLGMQRQALLSGIQIFSSTLGAGGAVLLLWLVSPTVGTFFTWQICASGLQVALVTSALWTKLPASDRSARFEPALVRRIFTFAAGMSGITFTALILTQMDKVILSKMLDLKTFGYYVLAGVVGNGLIMVIIAPTFNTIFPRFCALVAEKDEVRLQQMYHGSSQVMAIMIFPVTAAIGAYANEVMYLWTRNPEVAANTAPIVRFLMAAVAIQAMNNLPYALQIASGRTKVTIAINSASILTLVPLIWFMTGRFGSVGAASVLVALNGIYFFIAVPVTHRSLLKGEAASWLLKDVGIPLFSSILTVMSFKFLFATPSNPMHTAFFLLCVWLLAMTITAIVAPIGRAWIASKSKLRTS